MGSSQPTPRVGNLNGRRREVVRANRGTGSGTQHDESGSSHSTPPNSQLSSRNSSPAPIGGVRRRLSKRPRWSTIQTTENTEPETEPDGQGYIETVRLSDDSSDEYQASRQGDVTDPDTEPHAEDHDSAANTPSGRRRKSQAAGRHGNKRAQVVRISTTSGSQEAPLVQQTPAA